MISADRWIFIYDFHSYVDFSTICSQFVQFDGFVGFVCRPYEFPRYLDVISHVPDHNYKMTFCDLLYSIINDIELPTLMSDAFRIVKPSLCSVAIIPSENHPHLL